MGKEKLKVKIIHGMRNTRIYQIWADMKRRCYNKNCKPYKNYGERGISVCEDWKSSFILFYEWSLISGYDEMLTIDRIDNNGNYEPNNCKWSTMLEQDNNKRNNVYITIEGEIHTIAEWSRISGIPPDTLWRRIDSNWSNERLIDPVKNKGVDYNKKNKKWRARIAVNGKSIHIGWFTNELEAIQARKSAEMKYLIS